MNNSETIIAYRYLKNGQSMHTPNEKLAKMRADQLGSEGYFVIIDGEESYVEFV